MTCQQYGSCDFIPTVILIDMRGMLVTQVPSEHGSREDLAKRITSLLP